MGYDLHVEIPGNWPKGLYTRNLRNDNFTWNINFLLRETKWVGLKLRDLDGMPVWDAALILDDIYQEFCERPSYFYQFQVAHWGGLDIARQFVRNLAAELRVEYPEQAILRVG